MIDNVLGVTGHRPDKLGYGYNLSSPEWIKMREWFKTIIKKYNIREGINGAALGTDMNFALSIIELKNEGYPILLHCAIPFVGQESRWSDNDKNLYKYIISHSDKVYYQTGGYTKRKMDSRNEYIVDNSNMMVVKNIMHVKSCKKYSATKLEDVRE